MTRIIALLIAACALLVSAGTARADCRDFEFATRDLYRTYRAAAVREMQKYREKHQKVDVKEFWLDLSKRYVAGEGRNVSPMIGVFIAGMKDKLHDPIVEKAVCELGETVDNTTPMFVCATLIANDPARKREQKIKDFEKVIGDAGWSLKKRLAIAKSKTESGISDPYLKRIKLHLTALDKCFGTKTAARIP